MSKIKVLLHNRLLCCFLCLQVLMLSALFIRGGNAGAFLILFLITCVYPGANLTVAAYYMGEETDSFEEINEICEKHGVTGMNMHRPHCFDGIRERFESLRELIFSLSFLSPILSVACYTWVLLIATAYWIYHKNKKAVAVFIPLLLVLLVCFAGPCNGSYFRYFYPMTICLPAAMSLSWSRSKPLPETRESRIPG